MKEKLIGIGAAAKLSGLSERTLRYWESLGLIAPVRVPSGHRKYTKSMVKKIISLKETLDTNNLRINDLITSSAFLQDEGLKKKVKDLNCFNVGSEIEEGYADSKGATRVHPLTNLPDHFFIQQEIDRRLSEGAKTAICYVDLENFRAYNLRYGYQRGDKLLKFTSLIIFDVTRDFGNSGDVIGHLGGDNFVIVTSPDKYQLICAKLIENFDQLIAQQYDKDDRDNGYIININRKGEVLKFNTMTLTISVVTNERRNLAHFAQIDDIANELKQHAQKLKKSDFVVDKRSS
ncbi:MAG: MerR family DNA-binding transcriptional regulator [Candidatus Firestonebacteria bacterium]|nr:MerR family DNA-binding transcriptional regulator [Candidatus Firestonebacteria bacterium]